MKNPVIIINESIPAYDPDKKNIDEVRDVDETFDPNYIEINQEKKFVDGEYFDSQGNLTVNATPEEFQ